MKKVGWMAPNGQPDDITALQDVIYRRYGRRCKYLRTEFVRAPFNEHIPWDGIVRVFRLLDSEDTNCYAWKYQLESETKQVTVLESPEVDSAEAAVRFCRQTPLGEL